MKRLLFGILFTAMMLLNSACSGPSHMLMSKDNANLDIRTIKPEKGKAALVVTRTTSFAGAIEFDTYLDKKMIGVTKGRGFFVKRDIQPGIHYLIAKAESYESAKINFEPDRTYFIHYNPRPGWFRARISMYPQDPNKTMADMDGNCKLFEYDPKDPGDDLSDEDYNQAIQDYEKDVAGGEHKEYADYRGIEVK
jgi:hypothetical protein